MSIKVEYKNFLVYSEKQQKYFYTEFQDGINIVYGKNTSGKSTLFQLLNYTFGINDEKHKLKEILQLDITTRLDCDITINREKENLIIIRADDSIKIKKGNNPFKSFDGVGGDSSYEHKRLKEYIRNLFDFTLYLEQNGEYKTASIETIFLPYYVAQDVGWISIRKSFKGLDFYKNFKEDFLDYYLGVTNDIDRTEKIKLENDLKENRVNQDFYNKVETSNEDLKISQFIDEKYEGKSKEYIENHKTKKENLLKYEKEYVNKCNELAYYNQRKSVLAKVKKNLENQNPTKNDKCPVCQQILPYNTETAYEYFQDINDTEEEYEKIQNKIKSLQKDIDKLDKDIKEIQSEISKEYEILKQYENEEITYERWIEHKADIQLIEKIEIELDTLKTTETRITDELKKYKSDKEIKDERIKKENSFFSIFKEYITELGVKDFFDDERYKKIYRISFFPQQGVELLKSILAYNFAFNKVIQDTNVHRLPFMLDAIFKEDIEKDNKDNIIGFISKHKPKDTQIVISIAESQNENEVEAYNKKYFNGNANLICIGDKTKERAFLSKNFDEFNLIDKTISIVSEH